MFREQLEKLTFLDFYLKAIELDPEAPLYPTNLGECFRYLGRTDEAFEAYHQALEIDPDYESALEGLEKLETDRSSGVVGKVIRGIFGQLFC